MKRESTPVYEYKGWSVFQTKDDNDNTQPLLILRKENQQIDLELEVDVHATIHATIAEAVENKINALA